MLTFACFFLSRIIAFKKDKKIRVHQNDEKLIGFFWLQHFSIVS